MFKKAMTVLPIVTRSIINCSLHISPTKKIFIDRQTFQNGRRNGEPTRLWDEVYSKERVCCSVLPLLPLNAPIRADALRFLCVSDTHGHFDEVSPLIPPGDILLQCDDFTNFGEIEEIRKFNGDIGRLPHPHKLLIAGNHELGFEDYEDESQRMPKYHGRVTPHGYSLITNCTYLQDSLIEIEGVRVYGAPWVPLDGYSFSRPRGTPLLEKWLNIHDAHAVAWPQ